MEWLESVSVAKEWMGVDDEMIIRMLGYWVHSGWLLCTTSEPKMLLDGYQHGLVFGRTLCHYF